MPNPDEIKTEQVNGYELAKDQKISTNEISFIESTEVRETEERKILDAVKKENERWINIIKSEAENILNNYESWNPT